METSPPQSILVTGASGFIGVHLVRRLVARGDRVTCVVRASSNIAALRNAGAELVICDVSDRVAMSGAIAFAKVQQVFHLAGLVRALRFADFLRVNADGVEAVAGACADQPAPPTLVVVSSLAAAGPSTVDRPRLESDSPSPVSDYGKSKLAGERAAIKFAGSVPITIVRPCVVFGPGDRGVLEMFKPIARSGIHVVPSGPERRVSLVDVADVVECLLLAAEKGERLPAEQKPGQGIYFVADEEMTYPQFGGAIAVALAKKPPRIVRLPQGVMKLTGRIGDVISTVTRRAGWVGSDKISDVLAGSWTCSSAKAREQLGWAPAMPLAVRLRATGEWYRRARWL